MEHKQTNSRLSISGRIDAKVHNLDDLREQVDSWETLSKDEKLALTRDVSPEYEETVHNVTTDALHEYFVDNLDRSQTSAKSNLSADWMGLGNDATSGTATTDTDLNNRIYEETVTDHADQDKDLLASTFVDSTEANGFTLDEIGLFTGDPNNLGNADVFLINHATFSDVTKDNTKTVTFDVTLSFSDV